MTVKAISRLFLVLLLSLCTLLLSTMPAGAQAPTGHYTFTVNTTADTHDAHPGNGKCADKNGNCSLRAAIEEADALPAGSRITITVPAGTYGLTLGPLQFTANTIMINGAASKTTIIKGNVLSIKSAATVHLSQFTIKGSYGGGISNYGTLTVSNSIITHNVGGGISNGDGGPLTVNNSIITANTGSGIYNLGLITINNSTISNNVATSAGGGIYNDYYTGHTVVYHSTISGNSANSVGGGIFTVGYHGQSPVSVIDSTISGNSAAYGGGIEDDAADVTVSNSTISGNSATGGNGGGINFPSSDGGSVTVSNSTISGNSAIGKGGNIADTNINGPFTLTGTIVANSKGAPNCTRMITDKGYNLDSGTSCRFHKKTDLNNTNPMLGPLRNNGGPTQTMALQPGSKAIDWVALGNCPATDQRGHKRPDAHEQSCDIGAYESAYTNPSRIR